MSQRVVIVGAGQAGAQVAISLAGATPSPDILLIGQEEDPPYERPPLSKAFLMGQLPAERLSLRPERFYAERGIRLRLGVRVTAIDRVAQTVTLNDQDPVAYDALVLATGAEPRRLDLPGAGGPGVCVLRSRADATALQAALTPGIRLAVIGGGYIGLEVAAAAQAMGADVCVLEARDRLMARTASPPIAAAFQRRHAAAGVRIALGITLLDIMRDQGVPTGITTDRGLIVADLVVLGVGVTPEIALARQAGLPVRRGIVVDAHGRTADPQIYACGDCADYAHPLAPQPMVIESVQNAVDQAKAVAAAIAGTPKPYDAVPWFWSDQYDWKLQSAGLFDQTDRALIRGDPSSSSFSVCHLRQGRLVAVESLNLTRDFVQAKALIARGAKPDPALLADPGTPLKSLS